MASRRTRPLAARPGGVSMRVEIESRIAAIAAVALVWLTAGCAMDGELDRAADDAAEEESAAEPAGTWEESAPISVALTTGRARVGWPSAGIDLCGGECFICFYQNDYDKVFHQGHIVN